MIVIRFNQWDEFLEELKSNPPEDRVVRLAVSLRYNAKQIPHATMVAGCLIRDRVLEFMQYLGVQEIGDHGERSPEIAVFCEERKQSLQRHGFEVKAGRYHLPVHRLVRSMSQAEL